MIAVETAPTSPAADYLVKWAIIIGIDQYPGGPGRPARLMFAVNDAREVRDTLLRDYGYADDHVLFLADGQATLQSLREALERWMPGRSPGPDDSILVFFAGHGLIDEQTQEGYLVAVDSRMDDRSGTCLPVAWVRDRLAAMTCRHKAMILDSCYSGLLFDRQRSKAVVAARLAEAVQAPPGPAPDVKRTRGQGMMRRHDPIAIYRAQPAFLGLSAGRETPVADGRGKDRHSIFTAEFLKVLGERADSTRDDQAFTLSELATRVESRVRDAVDSAQVPEWGYLGPGTGDFVFRPTRRRATPSDLARRTRYIAALKEAKDAWNDRSLPLVIQRLESQHPGPGEVDPRGFEWFYFRRLTQGCAKVINTGWPIAAIAMAPGEKAVAAIDTLGVVKLWDFATGEATPFTDLPNATTWGSSEVAFTPDGGTLITLSAHSLDFWDLAARRKLDGFAARDGIFRDMALSQDGSTLAVAGPGKFVEIWDLPTRHRRLVITQDDPVECVDLSGDGRILAAGGGVRNRPGGELRLWNATTGQSLPLKCPPHKETVICVALASDGKWLASGDFAGTVLLTSLAEEDMRSWTSRQAFQQVIDEVRFAPDGRLLLATSGFPGVGDGGPYEMRLLDHGVLAASPIAHVGSVVSAAFSRNGKSFITGSEDGTIRIWDVSAVREWDVFGSFETVHTLAFSPDGRTLASGGSDPVIRLWDPATGDQQAALSGHSASITAVAFSRDGATLAAGSEAIHNEGPGELWLWDLERRRPRSTLRGQNRPVSAIVFSPDGRLLATGATAKLGKSPGELLLWDPSEGTLRATLRGHSGSIRSLAFAPDGTILAAAGGILAAPGVVEGELKLWDPTTGRVRSDLPGHRAQVNSVAFSPDGRMLASGSDDQTVKLWDVETGALRHTLTGHLGNVFGVAFSPDGRSLASAGSNERLVRFWDIETGQERVNFQVDGSSRPLHIHSLAFSPDGRMLALGMDAVRVLRTTTDEEILQRDRR